MTHGLLPVLLLVAFGGCTHERPRERGGSRHEVPLDEAGTLRLALASFHERDSALGAFVAASNRELSGWEGAARQLEARLAPIWSRRIADSDGHAEPTAPSPEPDLGEAAPEVVPRCAGDRCCAPSARPSPVVTRAGGRRMIRLDPVRELPGRIPQPNVLWSARLWHADVRTIGDEVAAAVGAGDDARAAPLAGLLIAELGLRRREARFARAVGDGGASFDCGPIAALVRELATFPSVSARARELGWACDDLSARTATPPGEVALPPGPPLTPDAIWRAAVEHARAAEPDGALTVARRLPRTEDARFALVPRMFASHMAYRLDRFPTALAELPLSDHAEALDPALTELLAGFAVLEVMQWSNAVETETWPGDPRAAPAAPPSAEPACGPLEVLEANLRGSSLLGPALRRYADIVFDMTMYVDAVAAYRAVVRQSPTSPEVLYARERIHEALLRNRLLDEARAEADDLAAFLAPGSAWARANASDAPLIARARDLVASVRARTQPSTAWTVGGLVDPAAVVHQLDQRRVLFDACLWGGRRAQSAGPAWARLELTIEEDGHLGPVEASTPLGSPAVARCLVQRARLLRFQPPEGGRSPLTVWLVAP